MSPSPHRQESMASEVASRARWAAARQDVMGGGPAPPGRHQPRRSNMAGHDPWLAGWPVRQGSTARHIPAASPHQSRGKDAGLDHPFRQPQGLRLAQTGGQQAGHQQACQPPARALPATRRRPGVRGADGTALGQDSGHAVAYLPSVLGFVVTTGVGHQDIGQGR